MRGGLRSAGHRSLWLDLVSVAFISSLVMVMVCGTIRVKSSIRQSLLLLLLLLQPKAKMPLSRCTHTRTTLRRGPLNKACRATMHGIGLHFLRVLVRRATTNGRQVAAVFSFSILPITPQWKNIRISHTVGRYGAAVITATLAIAMLSRPRNKHGHRNA